MTDQILLVMPDRALARDWLYRWIVTAATASVAGVGLSVMRVGIDYRVIASASQILIIFLAAGIAFAALAPRIPSMAFALSACADFFCSVALCLAFSQATLALTYVAASANLPLVDDVFVRLDAAMGFRWDDAYAWVQQHPVLQTVLWWAYLSTGAQIVSLLLIHSIRAPGEGTGELIWNFIVSLMIVTAISVFLPAVAKPGVIGQRHIDVFLAVRSGTLTLLDRSTVAGIVAFPSFHTAMAVICIFSARSLKWLFWLFAPLNILVIVATVPCGGHYLVDTIAGLAVAAVSILVVRRARR